MSMVKLWCAECGEVSVFSVTIAQNADVNTLKEAIFYHQRYDLRHDFPSSSLNLYLARDGNGGWMGDYHEAEKLQRGRIDSKYERMNPMLALDDTNCFGPAFKPGRNVHVLVALPPSEVEAQVVSNLSTFESMLKHCPKTADLPQEGDFLMLFEWTDSDCGTAKDIEAINRIVRFTGPRFYVRKEILCVLENLRKVYQQEFDMGEVCDLQFILMGSPGTGKSCILALLCFLIAVKYDRPVVWMRKVTAGRNVTATRLFYQGKYYEWDDMTGETYQWLRDAMKDSDIIDGKACWFVLDGISEQEVLDKKWSHHFALLATSGQFKPAQLRTTCLLPYWKQADLEYYGREYLGMTESEIDERSFVSGGNLQTFLCDHNAKSILAYALYCIGNHGHEEYLLNKDRLESNDQLDYIHMRGVQYPNNSEHYVDLWNWVGCVTSKFVMLHLLTMVKPWFFEKLMRVARELNDERLESVAYNEMDRKKKTVLATLTDYWAISTGGANIYTLEKWAKNPSMMTYWIPSSGLLGTIHAVVRRTFKASRVANYQDQFCLLQLTNTSQHKCNAAILLKVAKPFLDLNLHVCFVALVPYEATLLEFQWSAELLTNEQVVRNIPLYVACRYDGVMPK